MELRDKMSPDGDGQEAKGSVTLNVERLERSTNIHPPKTISTMPALAATATSYSAATQAATAFSGASIGRPLLRHSSIAHPQHAIASLQQSALVSGPILSQRSIVDLGSSTSLQQSCQATTTSQQNLEKLSRPAAFDKMESLVREMQDPERGVPVRQQKMFLTSIPYAFMGYDLIEWLMDRLLIEESEALNIANQLCLHGYFFPVNDTKILTVKDDSSLYRFQTPYYWPWQHKAPDNVEYAIYLVKRSMRNKQRHALEDYELEALASLHKNLKGKWEIIKMQAEEQVRLAKERKKGDKIVGDSQERAYWRVHRPPPGQFTPLEPCPVPSRDRQGAKQNKKKLAEDLVREIDFLKKSMTRTRIKMSQACESLLAYSETFAEYDFFLQPVLPSNPWVTEDVTFWQLNNNFVDVPTEKRVKRWAISIEELVSDPTGLQEFTTFLEKEYSHENIRFWIAVNRLRRSAHSQVSRKVQEIYELVFKVFRMMYEYKVQDKLFIGREFLKPGAPCEINIDGKTMESVLKGLKYPSRFTFDAASEHIYMLLLKKDCYPRFIRSDHYKRLLETGIQPAHKKRFFNFGGVGGAKKKMTAALSSQGNMSLNDGGGGGGGGRMLSTAGASAAVPTMVPSNLPKRRDSDRSLSGSAHELAAIDIKDSTSKVPHSHSQSNLNEIQHRDVQSVLLTRLDSVTDTGGTGADICPWDTVDDTLKPHTPIDKPSLQLSICPWEQKPVVSSNTSSRGNVQRLTSTSSDNSETNERVQRNLMMRHQHTVDSGETGMKRLLPNLIEPRRASVSVTPGRISEFPLGLSPASKKASTTPSPVGISQMAKYSALFKPLQVAQSATTVAASSITRDPPSNSDTEIDELTKLSLSERNSETSSSELPELSVLPTSTPTRTPPLITKVTPPPPPPFDGDDDILDTEINLQSHCSEEKDSLNVQVKDHSQDSIDCENVAITEAQNLETEVDVKIDEVQIELIETSALDYEHICEGQDPSIIQTNKITSVIQIEKNDEASTPVTSMAAVKEDEKLERKDVVDVQEMKLERIQENIESERVMDPPMKETTVEVYCFSEELSPTADEYQEGLQFGIEDKEVCGYNLVGLNKTGYIPPAPTPAPAMAPLAEMDTDTVDDEGSEEITFKELSPLPAWKLSLCPTSKHHGEETRRKRKKKHSDGKRMSSMEDKEPPERLKVNEASTSSAGAGAKNSDAKSETDITTVCPWEDENISTSDGTFVKTYATLGYL